MRGGHIFIIDWCRGRGSGLPHPPASVRTVFDVQARRYVELPLSEFQHLRQQGRIEESDSRTPHLWRGQKVYRLL